MTDNWFETRDGTLINLAHCDQVTPPAKDPQGQACLPQARATAWVNGAPLTLDLDDFERLRGILRERLAVLRTWKPAKVDNESLQS
jgi:hypothetical protein